MLSLQKYCPNWKKNLSKHMPQMTIIITSKDLKFTPVGLAGVAIHNINNLLSLNVPVNQLETDTVE